MEKKEDKKKDGEDADGGVSRSCGRLLPPCSHCSTIPFRRQERKKYPNKIDKNQTNIFSVAQSADALSTKKKIYCIAQKSRSPTQTVAFKKKKTISSFLLDFWMRLNCPVIFLLSRDWAITRHRQSDRERKRERERAKRDVRRQRWVERKREVIINSVWRLQVPSVVVELFSFLSFVGRSAGRPVDMRGCTTTTGTWTLSTCLPPYSTLTWWFTRLRCFVTPTTTWPWLFSRPVPSLFCLFVSNAAAESLRGTARNCVEQKREEETGRPSLPPPPG